MKKQWKIALTPIGVAIALAGGLVFAQMRSGSYGSSNATNIDQAAAPAFAPDAKYDAGPYPSFTPELAEGDGRQEAQNLCAICHSKRDIHMQQPMPGSTSEVEGSNMVRTY